ncbi:MAG TPA: hypothetical protein VIO64_00100 [Pseudobacteroides sp.]|uniref:hypothetical protein n=1 Tax=Pseudobacteroides sp. TaxID=1968840 RepID=UPI002F9257FD
MNPKIKIVLLVFALCILVTACLVNKINSIQNSNSLSSNKISNTTVPTNISFSHINTPSDSKVSSENKIDLDNLVKSFVFPPISIDNLNFNEECPGLPIELINKLKKAVYKDNSDSLIHELNDNSLMITAKDFTFKPNQSSDIDISEKDLNDAIQNGASNFLIYKCDTNGDGTDEIIMIQNLKYDYSSSNIAYILKKLGDKYVYAGYDFLGYYRCFAIFKNNGKFYLIANYDDYNTKTTKAVGIFSLNGDNSDFMWLLKNQHTYIRKISDGYQYNLLYKNINAPLVSDVQTYVNEIGTDLIYTDRTHKTFYGNETERYDLLDEARDNNPQLIFWNINSVDVNNDGKDDFFDRKILYNGGVDVTETRVNWYNPNTKTLYPAPFTVWRPNQYFLTQQWFKRIGGKTIIFSLYHKNFEEIYLLDARINENGQTTILLDYMINMKTNIELSDYWDYDDTNFVKIDYKDSDNEKAFPEDIDKRTKRLAAKVQGGFAAVNYKDKNIPNSLIILLEKALFNKNFDKLNLGTSSFEINKDDFYNKFGRYTYYDSKKDFDRYEIHIYKYSLDKNTYYLMVANSGGSARFVYIHLYKETDGELKVLDDWTSLDLNARVIKYNGKLYFIESSYNYYSKYTDTIYIYRLVPDKIKDFVAIEFKPNKFEWEEVFNNHQPYEKNITSYVASIKDDLMSKSPIDDNIQVYLGDEKNKIDADKKLRLKSVGRDHDYYEIDFNNDGEPEYFERHFWFPSNYTTLHLINNIYKFTNNRTVSIDGDFSRENSTLIQLWFKKIQGKVFTFRLFLNSGYNYFLNVSLVEDTNVTQIQSYLIAPKNKFNISAKNAKFQGM